MAAPSPLIPSNFPIEVQRNVLEYLFIDKQLGLIKRRPLPKSRAKRKLKALDKFPQFLAVVLVSKTFVDRRTALNAMLQNATLILKRQHFEEINHFLDERQRHLIKHIGLDWDLETARVGRKAYVTDATKIPRALPKIETVRLDLRKDRRFDIYIVTANLHNDPFLQFYSAASQERMVARAIMPSETTPPSVRQFKPYSGAGNVLRDFISFRMTNDPNTSLTTPLKDATEHLRDAILNDSRFWLPSSSSLIDVRRFNEQCHCHEADATHSTSLDVTCRLALFLRDAAATHIEVLCRSWLTIIDSTGKRLLSIRCIFSTKDCYLRAYLGTQLMLKFLQVDVKELFAKDQTLGTHPG